LGIYELHIVGELPAKRKDCFEQNPPPWRHPIVCDKDVIPKLLWRTREAYGVNPVFYEERRCILIGKK
jgi:hypothetical protein